MKRFLTTPRTLCLLVTLLAAIAIVASPAKADRTRPGTPGGSPGLPPRGFTYRTMNVSAYCLCEKCCGHWARVTPRRTASGYMIHKGDRFVAAPRHIKFGTLMEIPGYNNGRPVEVKDRGGAIKGNKLDLFFPSHKEALKFGRKTVRVKIYENTNGEKKDKGKR